MISGTSQLYFGSNNGKTYRFKEETYSDDTYNIAMRVRTKNYYVQPIDEDHQLQEVILYADEPQGTNFSISIDDDDYEYKKQIQEDKDPNTFKVWKHFNRVSFGLDEVSTKNPKIKGLIMYYA